MNKLLDLIEVVCTIFDWFPNWTFQRNLTDMRRYCHYPKGHAGECLSEYDWHEAVNRGEA